MVCYNHDLPSYDHVAHGIHHPFHVRLLHDVHRRIRVSFHIRPSYERCVHLWYYDPYDVHLFRHTIKEKAIIKTETLGG